MCSSRPSYGLAKEEPEVAAPVASGSAPGARPGLLDVEGAVQGFLEKGGLLPERKRRILPQGEAPALGRASGNADLFE